MPRLTREESRKQTRDRLVAAAAELFTEQGVNGTSVEQIAERAGYSRGAFYGNFDHKDDLVLEVLKQRTLREKEEVDALRQEARSFDDMLDRLREWNRARARHVDEWLSLRMELFLHALRSGTVQALFSERELVAREAIGSGIENEFGERGVEPPADPAFLALIVHALEDGLLLQRLMCPDGVNDEVVVDAVDLLMRSWTALSERKH